MRFRSAARASRMSAAAIGLTLIVALSMSVIARAGGDTPPPPCSIGALLNQGSTTISFSGSTATANVSGWSFCGESTQVAYNWSTGATSQSISVSPSQCVSVTTHIGTDSNGLAWSQSASGCAPSSGGGGGGGTPPPSCNAPNKTGVDSDHDGIDDACDPTPFPNGMTTGTVTLTSETDVKGPQRVLYGGTTKSCNGNARLKTRIYRASYTEAFVSSVTFVAFTAKYQVCYVPNGSIQWAIAYNPDSPSSLVPWSWQTTNDNGFPSAISTSSAATFQWQGTVAICAFSYACVGTRHPGLTIVFHPNNTETRSQYVG